jgi:hypothetical protein
MKCQNETVTIELKNGMGLALRRSLQIGRELLF